MAVKTRYCPRPQPKSKGSHNIRGRRIRIKRVVSGTDWGMADFDAGIMRLAPDAVGFGMLELIVHEFLHFVHQDWEESSVEEVGQDLASLLWKFRDEIFEEMADGE